MFHQGKRDLDVLEKLRNNRLHYVHSPSNQVLSEDIGLLVASTLGKSTLGAVVKLVRNVENILYS